MIVDTKVDTINFHKNSIKDWGVLMEHKCIYCGKEDDLSESDIIPDALTNSGIYNQNVYRTEYNNNKFSDMFESKVIDALSFITNKLNIKSSKSKGYAPIEIIHNNGTRLT